LLRALGLALLMTRDEVLLLDQDSIDGFYVPGGLRVRDSAAPAPYGGKYHRDLSTGAMWMDSR
jgi:hypothetical protein